MQALLQRQHMLLLSIHSQTVGHDNDLAGTGMLTFNFSLTHKQKKDWLRLDMCNSNDSHTYAFSVIELS